ncbi:MAG: type II methionyl aminopeptidase [Planctomycetes bacterium]|nr:type II methionyl aminopeptidase [Planctomycetota bacterium]
MNPQDLEKWRRAAAIACHVRKYVASLAKPGAKLIDIALAGHARIEELGGKPAFPLQMSRNHIAAHYCAWIGDPTTLQEGDVVKIDCGVHVDGFVADTAMTVDLSLDGRNRKLVEASQAALDAAIRVAGPDVDVIEIGREVERVIRSFGFSPVKNLTGHSVGRWIIHGPPQIPNVPVGRGKLRPGTCVAIEPFASTGAGIVKESGDAHVFMVRRDLKKAKGVDDGVYDAIRAFGGLPFGSRDLVAHLPFKAVSDSLNALSRDDQLMVYPPLCEKKGELVAQFEHTLLITDSGVEVLTASEDALRTPLSV